ncbi:hypothetical protein IAR55_002339 [Kwoniella newhampshirensis]|uniref:Uncharacterized protein n=1 Tax=Kwoniella newhampshirensis TaxID=1651941 RepID=A0AAW0Z180_9TREE
MSPIDLGNIGGAINGAITTAVDGAEGAASTAIQGAAGAATTAVKGAEGVASTVQGAIATASSAVGGGISDINNAKGMLKWFVAVQNWITKIEGYWNHYMNLIIFIVCLIIAIYVICILYCCYHFVHDFCRCCCCYIKCTYHVERFCYRHCKSCINTERHKRHLRQSNAQQDDQNDRGSQGGGDGEGYRHGCSRFCLGCVPDKTRLDLERQHGDLSKGWFDPTYAVRACGRYELPNDPLQRSKWHWWGHEDTLIHRWVENTLECFGTTVDKEKRLLKELRSKQKREQYWTDLVDRTEDLGKRVGGGNDDWRGRVHEQWARGVGLASQLERRMTGEEKKLLRRAEQQLGWTRRGRAKGDGMEVNEQSSRKGEKEESA